MGALHEGHLALVDAARAGSDAVVMSIFVNPTQFGPGEDLSRYPRDLARDRALAAARGVDALFVPDVETMYPAGAEVRVVPGKVAARWEGEFRPGHFAGVLTIVAKLFHLVEPDQAWFGQKDFQQATLIRQMVRDLEFSARRRGGSAPCGSAMDWPSAAATRFSHRADREQALGLSRALAAAAAAFASGERGAAALERVMRGGLAVHPGVEVEYIAVADPRTLEPVASADEDTVVLIAARVGSTRLIDNVILSEGL